MRYQTGSTRLVVILFIVCIFGSVNYACHKVGELADKVSSNTTADKLLQIEQSENY